MKTAEEILAENFSKPDLSVGQAITNSIQEHFAQLMGKSDNTIKQIT